MLCRSIFDRSLPAVRPARSAASRSQLTAALRATVDSQDADSPVFKLLPALQAQDVARFLPVPNDFREEVERASHDRHLGDLELLAAECQGFDWEGEGLRLVGRHQFDHKAYEGARISWEAVRSFDPADLEANLKLGTVFQRLRDFCARIKR